VFHSFACVCLCVSSKQVFPIRVLSQCKIFQAKLTEEQFCDSLRIFAAECVCVCVCVCVTLCRKLPRGTKKSPETSESGQPVSLLRFVLRTSRIYVWSITNILKFRVTTLCSLGGRYQHFEECVLSIFRLKNVILEWACSSETLGTTYLRTRNDNSESQNPKKCFITWFATESFPHLLLCLATEKLLDLIDLAAVSRKSLASLDVQLLQLHFRVIHWSVEKFPFLLLQTKAHRLDQGRQELISTCTNLPCGVRLSPLYCGH
jgi:hypothetical protein